MSRYLTTGLDPHDSRAEALRFVIEALEEEGIAEARNDARFLLLHALSLSPTDLALHPEAAVGAAAIEPIDEAIQRRRSGEPVARILGEWEFWGLRFLLSPHALVPRPDTETLVETALRVVADRLRSWRILDLGTGSGCILVALLRELPNARGIGTDLSLGAVRTAQVNAAENGVGGRAAFARADWCEALQGPFDLIASNPPYIASDVIPGLAVEVRRHDPPMALDGGSDGLAAYRAILGQIALRPTLLAADGAVILEIGHDQSEAVTGLGTALGFTRIDVGHDLAGKARVVTLRPPFDVTCAGNDAVRD